MKVFNAKKKRIVAFSDLCSVRSVGTCKTVADLLFFSRYTKKK